MSAFLGEDLQVESKESAPNFDEILHADYTDMVNMLKTYMYGTHGKTKKIQKDARELIENNKDKIIIL